MGHLLIGRPGCIRRCCCRHRLGISRCVFGIRRLFFPSLTVFLLWAKDQITSGSANFETVLSLLSSFFVPEDEDLLLTWISKTLADKELRSRMASWREDWGGLVQRGEEGEVLL